MHDMKHIKITKVALAALAMSLFLGACSGPMNGGLQTQDSTGASSDAGSTSSSNTDWYWMECSKDGHVIWDSPKYSEDVFNTPDGDELSWNANRLSSAYHIPPGAYCEEHHSSN